MRKINRDIRRHMYTRQGPQFRDSFGTGLGVRNSIENNTKVTEEPHLKCGYVIEDTIQPESLKFMVIPIKSMAPANNVSDQAFETMGNQMADTLDFQHEKNYTGAQAAHMIKTFANPTKQNETCA